MLTKIIQLRGKEDELFMFKVCSNISVLDLQLDFLAHNGNCEKSYSYKNRVLQVFNNALKNGYCCEEIYRVMNSIVSKKEKFTIEELSIALSSKKPNIPNLLGKDRTHSEMKIHSKAPILDIDFSAFSLKAVRDIKFERYVEPRASYTHINFLEYVKKKDRVSLISNSDERIVSTLRYLLGLVGDINIILFAFDLLLKHTDKKITNIIDISNYLDEAYKMHERELNRQKTGEFEFLWRERN